MKRILIPTESFRDWQQLLAKPKLHWKPGFSAMTLARSWEAASSTGFPPEVAEVLKAGSASGLEGIRFILAIPEYKVPLPGGVRSSQTDLMVLARTLHGLAVIGVEGKVDEPFGPTLAVKKAELSEGFNTRLDSLLKMLKLPATISDRIRYQLIHRTASALIMAEDYNAACAVMLVHSFSPTNEGFNDFEAFASLFGVKAEMGRLLSLGKYSGTDLFIAWCQGDQRFRS
ncbi:MAG: DUF6946 family protein [Syntrophobacteraceae bacterium]